jgi:ribA/ribD-fused uncharacterized protein
MSELPEDLNPMLDATQTKDGVTVFYTKFSPFSNHYMAAPFKLGQLTYSSTEQYYFAQKATQMGDDDKLSAILKEDDPAKIKGLGDKCKNVKNIKWESMMYEHMKNGNVAKYNQNPAAKIALMKTGASKLGEASASSEFWGVGMSMYDKERFNTNKWKNNAMGQILSDIRDSYN